MIEEGGKLEIKLPRRRLDIEWMILVTVITVVVVGITSSENKECEVYHVLLI